MGGHLAKTVICIFTALLTGLVAPTLVRPPLLSKGELEDVSDRVEPALCSKWPLTSGVAGGKGVSPFICPWFCCCCCCCPPPCCCWWWSFGPPPWGLTIRSPPPDWIWDSDNTKGGWWWPICVCAKCKKNHSQSQSPLSFSFPLASYHITSNNYTVWTLVYNIEGETKLFRLDYIHF